MSEIEPKEMVRRSTAITLGTVCVVLTVGLGVAMVQARVTNKEA